MASGDSSPTFLKFFLDAPKKCGKLFTYVVNY